VILDEPTSVLTPYESDEVLGMLQQMTRDGVLSVLLITHKFREVMRFADSYTVLRNGKVTGSGTVREVSPKHLAELMIGNEDIAAPAERAAGEPGETRLQVRGVSAHNERGVQAVRDLSFSIRAGEILGIAGVSGNGQRELVEAFSGSRAQIARRITAHGAPYRATRREMRRQGFIALPRSRSRTPVSRA
jgi:general nucleoside transport system ATP-binding protein